MGRWDFGGANGGAVVTPLTVGALLAGAVCAGFTVVASVIVFVAYLVLGAEAEPGFLAKVLLKATGMAVVAALCLWGLWRQRGAWMEVAPFSPPGGAPKRGGSIALLFIPFLLCTILVFPNLSMAPRTEPDELHHLIVSRNMAEHGVYGSGNPDAGFIWFDHYDSVGAPVLYPIAWLFEAAGSTVGAARFVMALYALGLTGAFLLLWRRPGGLAGAVLAALLMLVAPMTPYLLRTLYGEAPALAWWLLGLFCWRASFGKPWSLWAGVAGICIGLAVLSKTYMLLSVFAFGGAIVFDGLGERRLRVGHLVLPAAGVVLVLGAWSLFESSHAHDVATSAQSTLMEYQHYLMFGLGPLGVTGPWWLGRPLSLALCLAGAGFGAFTLFRRGSDPALVTAWLFALFVIFWWMCFTVGHIQRYAWYGIAILAAFGGPMLVALLRLPPSRRIPALMAAGLVVCAAVWETAAESRRFWYEDAMAADLALAAYVASVPADSSVGVGFWPLTRYLDFETGRNVRVVYGTEGVDVIVVAEGARNTVEPGDGFARAETFGPYTVYTRKPR